MAISASSYFSNSLVGQMNIGSDIDIYETSSNPKFAVGTGFQRVDGNKYRYAEFGALTARGQVVCGNGGGATTSLTCISAALVSPTLVRYGGVNIDPNAAGSNYLQVCITATAEQFSGGYMTIISGSGSGYSYRIKGNTAVGTPSTGYTYFDIYDKLVGPVDTTSAITIGSMRWNDVVPGLSNVNLTGTALAGVSVVNQSAGNYGWVCTRGYTHVLQGVTCSQGSLVILSSNTAGAVQMASVYGTNTSINCQIVGQAVIPASATGYSLIDVWLE